MPCPYGVPQWFVVIFRIEDAHKSEGKKDVTMSGNCGVSSIGCNLLSYKELPILAKACCTEF
jgi:hypothetical protein